MTETLKPGLVGIDNQLDRGCEPVGIEPTTFRLQGECSTTELRRHTCCPEYIQRSPAPDHRHRQATIDTIEPGAIAVPPPPDRQIRRRRHHRGPDLATKIGAVLLDSGTAASDTQAQVEFIAGAYGLDDVDVDVTYNKIMASARRGATPPPITTMAQVRIPFPRLHPARRRRPADPAHPQLRDHPVDGAPDRRQDHRRPASLPHRVSTVAWG